MRSIFFSFLIFSCTRLNADEIMQQNTENIGHIVLGTALKLLSEIFSILKIGDSPIILIEVFNKLSAVAVAKELSTSMLQICQSH